MKRKILFLISLALLTALVAACGAGADLPQAAPPNEAGAAASSTKVPEAKPAAQEKKRQEEPVKKVIKVKEEWTEGLESGLLTKRVEYDEKGREILELAYGKDGNLSSKSVQEYNEDGGWVIMRYDSNENLETKRVSEKTDLGRRVSTYDSNGALRDYYDASTEKTDFGLVDKCIFYDSQGNVTGQNENKYNSDKQRIEYYDSRQGRRDLYEYDSKGRIAAKSEIDLDTSLVKARIEYQYDENGGVIEEDRYGILSDSSKWLKSLERYENVYNSSKRLVEKRYIESIMYGLDGSVHATGLSYGPDGVRPHYVYGPDVDIITIRAEVTGYDEYGNIIHKAKKEYTIRANEESITLNESNASDEYDIVDYRYEYWN